MTDTAAPDPLDLQFPVLSDGLKAIVVNPTPAGTAVYTLGGEEALQVELLSVDVDATASAVDVHVQVDLVAKEGVLLARVRTASAITAGTKGQATFAPGLEDTAALPPPTSGTDIQSGLWATAADSENVITASAVEIHGTVTQARMWTYNLNETGGRADALPPLLAFV